MEILTASTINYVCEQDKGGMKAYIQADFKKKSSHTQPVASPYMLASVHADSDDNLTINCKEQDDDCIKISNIKVL